MTTAVYSLLLIFGWLTQFFYCVQGIKLTFGYSTSNDGNGHKNESGYVGLNNFVFGNKELARDGQASLDSDWPNSQGAFGFKPDLGILRPKDIGDESSSSDPSETATESDEVKRINMLYSNLDILRDQAISRVKNKNATETSSAQLLKSVPYSVLCIIIMWVFIL